MPTDIAFMQQFYISTITLFSDCKKLNPGCSNCGTDPSGNRVCWGCAYGFFLQNNTCARRWLDFDAHLNFQNMVTPRSVNVLETYRMANAAHFGLQKTIPIITTMITSTTTSNTTTTTLLLYYYYYHNDDNGK